MDADMLTLDDSVEEPSQRLTDIETEIISSDDMQQMHVDLSRNIPGHTKRASPKPIKSATVKVQKNDPVKRVRGVSVRKKAGISAIAASVNSSEKLTNKLPIAKLPAPLLPSTERERLTSTVVSIARYPVPKSLVPTLCWDDLSKYLQLQKSRNTASRPAAPPGYQVQIPQFIFIDAGQPAASMNSKLSTSVVVRQATPATDPKSSEGTAPHVNKLPIPKNSRQCTSLSFMGQKQQVSFSSAQIGKPCHCSKSHCLKLYCDCFNRGVECQAGCACVECHNNSEHEADRSVVIAMILSKNSQAFQPKVQTDSQSGSGDKAHVRGCRCRKSGCSKRYCECYLAKVSCGSLCRCTECGNTVDAALDYEDSPGGLPKVRSKSFSKKEGTNRTVAVDPTFKP
ncbi:protein lin-54 homolog [Paramacrobiotus metropolitanus]|uniref:protein lin-54 homolog n=1 Tax=Paramacrobiotus metropolitanus TaxID=2943436 RepID=UPI002445646B|nr:protein lin-54 homolog [Paramacrobiotus metropolitanus]